MTITPEALFPATLSLAELVSQGWEHHPERPRSLADALAARAPTLPADADAAGAITLAEHTCLAHLHQPARLKAFLESLPAATAAAEATAPAVQRARWVLAAAQGEALPPIDTAPRWRAMQNLWTLWIGQGRADEARAMLAQELPQALAHADPAARRALAAACNNLAAELQEGRRGHADLDALMFAAAEASLQLWRSAGTWLHHERAEYGLARCHAAVGEGEAALRHAEACLAIVEQHAAEADAPFERFFGHEAAAWAHRARGDVAAVAQRRTAMLQARAEVKDPSLLPWCDKALATLDAARN